MTVGKSKILNVKYKSAHKKGAQKAPYIKLI
jgi:hypothetical protein